MQLQFLTLTFRCRYLSGEARVADDENLEVRWFGLDRASRVNERTGVHLESGLVADGPPQLRT